MAGSRIEKEEVFLPDGSQESTWDVLVGVGRKNITPTPWTRFSQHVLPDTFSVNWSHISPVTLRWHRLCTNRQNVSSHGMFVHSCVLTWFEFTLRDITGRPHHRKLIIFPKVRTSQPLIHNQPDCFPGKRWKLPRDELSESLRIH